MFSGMIQQREHDFDVLTKKDMLDIFRMKFLHECLLTFLNVFLQVSHQKFLLGMFRISEISSGILVANPFGTRPRNFLGVPSRIRAGVASGI